MNISNKERKRIILESRKALFFFIAKEKTDEQN